MAAAAAAAAQVGLRLALTYPLYGLLGYAFERLVVRVPRERFSRPFLHVYGTGAVLLALIDEATTRLLAPKKLPFLLLLLVKVLVATTVITSTECVFGHVGSGTWDYAKSGHHCVACSGYVSLESVGCWLLLSTVFFLLDPVKWAVRAALQN